MSRRIQKVTLAVLFLVTVTAASTYLIFSREKQATLNSLSAGSQIVLIGQGQVEFARVGHGPPVLVLHGAGGGYDQGLLIARTFGGEGFQWIVPSRFGYLRSSLPTDATTAAQADAFAELLDGLGVDRVGIIALSGGVPPALQFALRYPARTSALVLLSSAPYTPLTAADQELPIPAWLYQALFGCDFPYWLLKKTARTRLETIFDVKPDFRARLSPDDRMFITAMVDAFEPVTMRTDGLRNEGAAIDPKAHYALESIKIPTLIVHAQDDGINPIAIGEYTAQQIPDAEFVRLTTGGHLLLGHHTEIQSTTNMFLREAVLGSSP